MLITMLHLSGLLLVVIIQVKSIRFKDNEYDDTVIAIHPDLKEDSTLITELQDMFISGSEILYQATRHRAYFGEVKLLIPSTWKYNSTWSAATTETFEDADIRVDKPHVSHGRDPYTFQPGQCGESGRYIHLTAEYLTDQGMDRDVNYGPTGKTLVHEFAHLRYGVFDEYGLGTEEHPTVYLEGDTWLPTGCTSGTQEGVYTGNCQINVTNNTPGRDCFFIPDRDEIDAKSAIMYHPASEETYFCESDPLDVAHVHNSLAPNNHNKMCNGRGVWDVIKEHSDFKGGNSAVNISREDLQPTFKILYMPRSTPHGLMIQTSEQIAVSEPGFVVIDSPANREAIFEFTFSGNISSGVTLMSPGGEVYNSTAPECFVDRKLNTLTFKFMIAKPGTWTYSLTSSTPETVSLVVNSLPSESDPYRVDAWLSSRSSNDSQGATPIVVYVHVYKGYSPVTDADVTATVIGADAFRTTLKLFDNGILPDSQANDGVYSAYLFKFESDGKYRIHIEVQSVPGITKYYVNGPPTYGGAPSRYNNTTSPVVEVLAENFTRTSSPGAVDVHGFVNGSDNFAPSRVTDMKITDVNNDTRQVTLTWTAPGDDHNHGTASRYDIRIAQSANGLQRNFQTAMKVTPDMFVSGSLVPKPAGSKETIVLKVPSNWTTFSFALKTFDFVRHLSQSSNIASGTFERTDIKGKTTTTTAVVTTSMSIPTTTTPSTKMITSTPIAMITTSSTSTTTILTTPSNLKTMVTTTPTPSTMVTTAPTQTPMVTTTPTPSTMVATASTQTTLTINIPTTTITSSTATWSTTTTMEETSPPEKSSTSRVLTTQATDSTPSGVTFNSTLFSAKSSAKDKSDKISTTVIICIVIGSTLALCILIGIMIFILRRKYFWRPSRARGYESSVNEII